MCRDDHRDLTPSSSALLLPPPPPPVGPPPREEARRLCLFASLPTELCISQELSVTRDDHRDLPPSTSASLLPPPPPSTGAPPREEARRICLFASPTEFASRRSSVLPETTIVTDRLPNELFAHSTSSRPSPFVVLCVGTFAATTAKKLSFTTALMCAGW